MVTCQHGIALVMEVIVYYWMVGLHDEIIQEI